MSVKQVGAIKYLQGARPPRSRDPFATGKFGLQTAIDQMGYEISSAQAALKRGLIKTLAPLAANQ